VAFAKCSGGGIWEQVARISGKPENVEVEALVSEGRGTEVDGNHIRLWYDGINDGA
jgi:hypothetical protein